MLYGGIIGELCLFVKAYFDLLEAKKSPPVEGGVKWLFIPCR